MSLPALAQHGGHGGAADLAYFWASILTILLPVAAFVTLAVLTVRGYLRRREADGGGPAPLRSTESGMRNVWRRLLGGGSGSGP